MVIFHSYVSLPEGVYSVGITLRNIGSPDFRIEASGIGLKTKIQTPALLLDTKNIEKPRHVEKAIANEMGLHQFRRKRLESISLYIFYIYNISLYIYIIHIIIIIIIIIYIYIININIYSYVII